MAREYKFRGVDALTGEWLYGSLIQRKGYFPSISYNYPSGDGKISYCEAPVNAESVGQFTGFKDMNDIDIYEGDIVKDCHSFYFAGDKFTKKIRGAYDVTYDKDKREVSYYRNYVVEWGSSWFKRTRNCKRHCRNFLRSCPRPRGKDEGGKGMKYNAGEEVSVMYRGELCKAIINGIDLSLARKGGEVRYILRIPNRGYSIVVESEIR